MTSVTPSGLLCYTVMVCDPVNAGGVVSPEDTTDHEEKEQCIKMHEIINQYNLDGEFRYDSFTHMSCQAIYFFVYESHSTTAKVTFPSLSSNG